MDDFLIDSQGEATAAKEPKHFQIKDVPRGEFSISIRHPSGIRGLAVDKITVVSSNLGVLVPLKVEHIDAKPDDDQMLETILIKGELPGKNPSANDTGPLYLDVDVDFRLWSHPPLRIELQPK